MLAVCLDERISVDQVGNEASSGCSAWLVAVFWSFLSSGSM